MPEHKEEIDGKELWFRLGKIDEALATVVRTLGEDRIASASYRTDVRQELVITKENILIATNDIKTARQDIAKMEPVVAGLNHARLVASGVSSGMETLADWLARIAHVVSALIGGAIVFFLSKWFGK